MQRCKNNSEKLLTKPKTSVAKYSQYIEAATIQSQRRARFSDKKRSPKEKNVKNKIKINIKEKKKTDTTTIQQQKFVTTISDMQKPIIARGS